MNYLDQNHNWLRLLCCVLSCLLSPGLMSEPGLAQTANGVIKGTVLDQYQAVVPGAQVTLTNENTNISAKMQTNGAGIYYFGAVQPGPCNVVVELTGFKKWEGKLQLQVGQTAVVDVKLEVGNIENTIEVTGASPPITTESAEIAGVKDSQRIEQLPLNGRQISNLFNLTPGVEGAGNPRVNGMKVGSAEMLVDGVSIVDRFGGGIARVQPALDTIQEFRIETVGSNAQYAQPATITLLTKSGTNTFHGSIFETHRNNAGGLRARQRQDGDTSAKLIRNEFGVSAGGPIYLGSLYDGRNKSFWFAAYEGLRQRESHFTEDVVPTPAMWGGDFSNLVDNNGNRTHIYDPLTTDANGVRQQFPNDIIPEGRINPFYKAMQALTALPTSNTLPTQGPNFDHFYPATTDTNTFTIKGDHRFSDKDSISARFTRSRRLSQTFGGVYGNPAFNVNDAFGSLRQDVKIYDPSIQHTHVFSPTFLNELLVSGHRSNNGQGTLGDLTDWAGKLGLPNPFGVTGWPTFYATEVSGYAYFGWDGDNRGDQQLTSYVVEDNLTWIKGKHSMKFGGRFRQEYNNVRELQQAQGSHDFGPDWTGLYDAPNDAALPYTGSGLADMALGLPTTLRNQYNHGYYYFRQKEFGLYFHDNWKVSPRLTLDLGLRWDKWTPYNEKYNRLVNLDLATFANTFQVITPNNVRMEDIPGTPAGVLSSWAARGLTWKTANEVGFPGDLFAADNNNFGPRVGAAFKLTDKTVLRGSFGEYFWTMPLAQILQASRTNAPLNLLYISHFSRLDGTGTYGLRNPPNADFFIPDAKVDVGAGSLIDPTAAQGFRAFDGKGWKDARSQSWHLTIEREVMRNTALRLSYIGDHARDLEQVFDINSQVDYSYVLNTGLKPPGIRALERVNPNWNLSGSKNRTGYSNTHSAQVEIERKYSNGLAFQWFYTFTRSRTTTDAGGFTNGGGGINNTDGQNSVPENIELLGQPNLTYDQRLRLIYQNSSNIPGHRIRYNGIYDLPFGRGMHFGGNIAKGLDYLVGGWQVAFIGDWRGGFWRSVTANDYLQGDPTLSPDQRLLLTFNGRTQRLWFRGDFLPTNATNVSQDALQALIPVDRAQRVLRPLGPSFNNRIPVQLADGSTFLVSLSGTLNPNARAFYQGPGAWNDDISVYKNFKFTERLKARFSADFFNAFNHPNDQDPNSTTGLQDLSTQPNDPRIIQFSLRVSW